LSKRDGKLSSLKSKLLFTTLGVIAIAMLILSAFAFIHWRKLIVNKEIKSAESVTEAFSVFVLNTLIYGETLSLEKEYIIDSYISDFMGKNKDIKFINVWDNSGKIIAANNYGDNNFLNLPFEDKVLSKTSVLKDKKYKWIIVCTYRLKTGNKVWGVLQIGFSGVRMQKELATLYKILIAFQIIILFVLFVVLYIFIDKITSSLEELTSYVEKLEFSSPEKVVFDKRRDEVGVLTAAFINLQHRLKTSRDELIKAEKQVFHAEKLASIGRLASGVAHEINNPLNGIKNCLFTIKREIDNPKKAEKYLNLAEEGLNNIETVVKKLLGFAKKQSDTKVDLNLNIEVEKVAELLNYRLHKDNIDLKLSLSDSLKNIKGDSALIQEVLMNLLLNAYDSVSENGQIVVETANEDGKVKLSVIDNGCGIADKHLDKIFEPFFSTKEQGKGTGLGLSVVVSIVESLNGEILVESEENKGTKFILYFPAGENE
jgi:signal transduction histidine kinase